MPPNCYLLFIILASIVPSYVYGVDFRCEARTECENAQCEFPITCSNGEEGDENLKRDLVDLTEDMESLRENIRNQSDVLQRLKENATDTRKPNAEEKQDLKRTIAKLTEEFEQLSETVRKQESITARTLEDIQELKEIQSNNTQVHDLKRELTELNESSRAVEDNVTRIRNATAEFDRYLNKTDFLDLNLATAEKGAAEVLKENLKQEKNLTGIQMSNEENQQLREVKHERLEKNVFVVTEEITRIKEILTGCRAGEFRYNNSCYWIKLRSWMSFTFSDAETICQNRNSTVGYPVDKSHYDLLMRKVRERIPRRFFRIYMWTGIRQDPKTGAMVVSGMQTPYLKWKHGEPNRRLKASNAWLWVDSNARSWYNGLDDARPTYRGHGAICMYESPCTFCIRPTMD